MRYKFLEYLRIYTSPSRVGHDTAWPHPLVQRAGRTNIKVAYLFPLYGLGEKTSDDQVPTSAALARQTDPMAAYAHLLMKNYVHHIFRWVVSRPTHRHRHTHGRLDVSVCPSVVY